MWKLVPQVGEKNKCVELSSDPGFRSFIRKWINGGPCALWKSRGGGADGECQSTERADGVRPERRR